MYKKVMCPIEIKGGRTIWRRSGSAFDNKDGSINVVLDVLPTNGKLQIRDLDERDKEYRDSRQPTLPSTTDTPPF